MIRWIYLSRLSRSYPVVCFDKLRKNTLYGLCGDFFLVFRKDGGIMKNIFASVKIIFRVGRMLL